MFLKTRVIGLPIPRHRNFEEVNLRFYVRKQSPDGWRRGVVFVRELVPRRAIAWVARVVYGEPYLALPMRHAIAHDADRLSVEYQWRRSGAWETLAMNATKMTPEELRPGSQEEFITERSWGYTKRGGRTSEALLVRGDVEVRSGRGYALRAAVYGRTRGLVSFSLHCRGVAG